MSKTKYWLFWSDRGYEEHDWFDTRKEAVKRFKEIDNGYRFPILIKGIEIWVKQNDTRNT